MRRLPLSRASHSFPPPRIAQAVSAGWTTDSGRRHAWVAIAGPDGTVAQHRPPCLSAWQTRPAETCPARKMPLTALDEFSTGAVPEERLGPSDSCRTSQCARNRTSWRLLGLTATLAEIGTHRQLKNWNEPPKAQSTRD